jgi:hypothetical protein
MNTLLIEVTNQKAIGFLQKLEEQHLIKVLRRDVGLTKGRKPKLKLSEKYYKVLTKAAGESLMDHIKQMRKEWDNT